MRARLLSLTETCALGGGTIRRPPALAEDTAFTKIMTLRILHILDHSLPLHSGYAFRTIALLREQRALGWNTEQMTTPKQGATAAAEETVDGWHFFRTEGPSGSTSRLPFAGEFELMRRTARRIAEVVDRTRPDILHAHSPVLNALPAIWVGRRRRIPVVYELRALWEAAAVDHGTTTETSFRYRLSRAVETFALRHAGQITTICEGLRANIADRGIDPAKITVIPNAVDPNEFKFGGTADPALAESLGLVGARVAGFAGSFYAYEGLDLLVEAVPRLLRHIPNLKVLLVGGGFQEDALRAQVERLGLQRTVIFTGRVPHDRVQRYYDLVDVLVYPRRSMLLTDVVTPLKPLEAMAQGRILVASDVGGHRELIRDGHTGLMFKAGDVASLERVVAAAFDLSPEKREAIRRAGRRFVESERTWARSAAGYAGVYERLLPGVAVTPLAARSAVR